MKIGVKVAVTDIHVVLDTETKQLLSISYNGKSIRHKTIEQFLTDNYEDRIGWRISTNDFFPMIEVNDADEIRQN